LQAPQAASERLYALISKEKTTNLTALEKDELDHHLVLERLIRLAKAHARVRLASI
jgi:DNA replicative helicase MCM subunit Mcm2 (Cdc46/Mcm family)